MGRMADITGNKYNRLTVLEKTTQKSGSNYLWKCLCDCGNETLATKAALENGHKKSCGCLHTDQRRALGKSKKKDLLNQKFGSLLVFEETDKRKDGRVVWKCKCDCGNVIEVSSHDLLEDRKTHCGCQLTRSKGEQKIIELLNKYHLNFEQEKTFTDLKHNGKYLRYDFYVENAFLIEYDGKQHFIKDTGYGADLENIQYRDQLKNAYAKNQNIPLIRISYENYDSFTIEDLIPDNFKFLLKNKEDISNA